MRFSDDLIEEIRSRNDIVDIISGYANLKKRGNSYTACCPFHHEKTPSFHVSREKQMYHCFGCGVGGNVYTFVMEYENITFPESIEMLAERAGIAIPKEDMSAEAKRQADKRIAIKDMNKQAAGYFHYLLKMDRGKKAYEYLINRGITDATIVKFGLGYADVYSDDLYKYLKGKGYKDEALKDAGLIKIDEIHGASDRFWNRVMFPIIDINNRVVGFGGRVMGDGKPKYINTSDTPVFDKSRNLYGLNLAKKSKRKSIIFCEGYMDVISMHQAGFDNAVASLGTALTVGQVGLIKRFTESVYLAYDSDEAGTKAALRALEIFREFEMSARVIALQPYKDPDELIQQEGVKAFEQRIEDAISGIMFEISVLSKIYNQADPAGRTAFQKEAAKKLAMIEEPLERKNYLQAVVQEYQVDGESLSDAVTYYGIHGIAKIDNSIFETGRSWKSREEVREEQKQAPQKILLTWLINEPILFQKLAGIIGPDDFYGDIYHKIASMLYQQFEETGKVMPASVLSRFGDVDEQKKAAAIVQTKLAMDIEPEENAKVVTDVVKKVKMASIDYEMNHTKDMKRLQALIAERGKVAKLHISL